MKNAPHFFIVFLICLSGQAFAQDISIPVMVGGEPDLDACGLLGAISGLQAKPNNALHLRSGPSTAYPIIGRLTEGSEFIQCDSDNEAKWIGIVIPRDKKDDCGMGSPIPERQKYQGNCQSGWIFKSYTKIDN